MRPRANRKASGQDAKPTSPRLEPPVIALGLDAVGARDGCFGVLLGARRPDWIDVVRFAAVSGGLEAAVEARFASHTPWEAVGLALPDAAMRPRDRAERLLEALVPGDVVATEREVRFHAGDRWTRVETIRP